MATAAEDTRPSRPSLWQRILLGRRQLKQRTSGSLSQRMILVAAVWIGVLLAGGGFALDRVLAGALTSYFDQSLDTVLRAQILSAEIGPDGEVMFSRTAADQRFLEPYSGLYWQISGAGHEDFPSRSLWDRQLDYGDPARHTQPFAVDSNQFPTEKLRVAGSPRSTA